MVDGVLVLIYLFFEYLGLLGVFKGDEGFVFFLGLEFVFEVGDLLVVVGFEVEFVLLGALAVLVQLEFESLDFDEVHVVMGLDQSELLLDLLDMVDDLLTQLLSSRSQWMPGKQLVVERLQMSLLGL